MQHTYECFLKEVQEACCDEGGANCVAGSDVPNTCPVGCALVFPTFWDQCEEHIEASVDNMASSDDYARFAEGCLEADGLKVMGSACLCLVCILPSCHQVHNIIRPKIQDTRTIYHSCRSKRILHRGPRSSRSR